MKLLLFMLSLILVSCSVIQKNESSQKNDILNIELGTIGAFDKNSLYRQFQTNAIPVLKQKVRVSVTLNQFDKSSAKRYNKLQQEDSNKIILNDSLKNLNSYIQFNLIDKVTLIDELNAIHNKNIFNYLKRSKEPNIVTSLAIFFPDKIQNNIISASDIYLVNNGNKKYVLELYKNGKLTETIDFSSGTPFSYKVSNFCWTENEKRFIVITDISNGKCFKKTYRTYHKAANKKKEFKF